MLAVNEDHLHVTWQTEVQTVKFIWKQCLKLIAQTSNKNLLVVFYQKMFDSLIIYKFTTNVFSNVIIHVYCESKSTHGMI